MTKNYYAINWSKGRAVCANSGKRYGVEFHAFPTKSARQEWIDNGGDFTSSPNFRETIPASDAELRAEIRAEGDPYAYESNIVRH